MSVSTEISRLTSLRNSIRTKLIALGILNSANADLQDIYNGINGVSAKSSSDLQASGNTVTAPAGFYSSAASKTVGTAKAAATITPGTQDQTIAAGTYLSGAQTIKGDANLIAANIKKGVTIFGITGTFTGIVDSNDTEDPLRLTYEGRI